MSGQPVAGGFAVDFPELEPDFSQLSIAEGDPGRWSADLAEQLATRAGSVSGATGGSNRTIVGTAVDLVMNADFDKDGDVDGDDFLIWQVSFLTPSGATSNDGDADGNGTVDGDDFLIWQREFGSVFTRIPEPTALSILGVVAAISLAITRRRI